MENPVNYASLIQLAVTFNFVFVVFRYQSEDKAKMLIDTLIEKWKEQFQEETNALFIAIQEMVNNKFSVFIENPVIKKYHDELKKQLQIFQQINIMVSEILTEILSDEWIIQSHITRITSRIKF